MVKKTSKRGPHTLSQAENIREYLRVYPEKSVSEVAKAMGVTYARVYQIKQAMQDKAKKLKTPKWQTVAVVTSDTPLPVTMHEPAPDPVNHPAHYKTGGIETIDFIEAKKLGYNLGNVVKYITRADHKGNRKQDLEKALWYLNREIKSA